MIVRMLVAASLGAVSWTLVEYVLHRWMGHDGRFRRTPFAKEHIRHHIEGGYFAPTWKKALIALVVTAVLCVPAMAIAGIVAGGAYVVGLMSFYGTYEWLHRREHTHAWIGPYGRWARRHHFFHHFVDGKANHGVTSPLWDLVFGTWRRPGTIPVPAKLCMPWLRDDATGGVLEEFADTFVLTSPASSRKGARAE